MAKIRIRYLFIFASIFFSLLIAQESGVITPKVSSPDLAEPRLLVDDGEGLMMSYADANLVMTNKFFGLKERLNSRRWRGYQGNVPISESKFFGLAGFAQEAKMAARYQTIRQSVFWTGTGIAALGLLIGATQAKNDNKWHVSGLGIGLFATGISLDLIWYLAPPNQNKLSTALAAANKYNQRE